LFKESERFGHAVFDLIEGWYSPHRPHSALGYLSAGTYELRMTQAA